jgi:hypothetical protein
MQMRLRKHGDAVKGKSIKRLHSVMRVHEEKKRDRQSVRLLQKSEVALGVLERL